MIKISLRRTRGLWFYPVNADLLNCSIIIFIKNRTQWQYATPGGKKRKTHAITKWHAIQTTTNKQLTMRRNQQCSYDSQVMSSCSQLINSVNLLTIWQKPQRNISNSVNKTNEKGIRFCSDCNSVACRIAFNLLLSKNADCNTPTVKRPTKTPLYMAQTGRSTQSNSDPKEKTKPLI